MAEGGYLKVCYRKHLINIKYGSTNRYEHIIKLIIQRFNIPAAHAPALLISTENGRILDKELFDYFLTLFPNPTIIFYVRYDYNRAVSLLLPTQCTETANDDTNVASSALIASRSKEVNSAYEEDNCSYQFTPVFRMNCFIYEYPKIITRIASSDMEWQESRAEQKLSRKAFTKRTNKNSQRNHLQKRARKPLTTVNHLMRL